MAFMIRAECQYPIVDKHLGDASPMKGDAQFQLGRLLVSKIGMIQLVECLNKIVHAEPIAVAAKRFS